MLSKEKIEQIRKDAVRHCETKGFYMTNNISREEGYIEGATAEAQRAEVWKQKAEATKAALENLMNGAKKLHMGEAFLVSEMRDATKAIEQYNSKP